MISEYPTKLSLILDPNEETNLKKLSEEIGRKLPKYAQPLFVRLTRSLELTGTYKIIKRNLQNEGYNVNALQGDPIFFKGPKDKMYSPFTSDDYNNFVTNLKLSKL